MDGGILLQCISKSEYIKFCLTVEICVCLFVGSITYHANNACVIHVVYYVMYIGITGIPMAILLLSIELSIECHADCVTVVTMPLCLHVQPCMKSCHVNTQ